MVCTEVIAAVAQSWRRSRRGDDGRKEVATVAVGLGVAIADRGRDLPCLSGVVFDTNYVYRYYVSERTADCCRHFPFPNDVKLAMT